MNQYLNERAYVVDISAKTIRAGLAGCTKPSVVFGYGSKVQVNPTASTGATTGDGKAEKEELLSKIWSKLGEKEVVMSDIIGQKSKEREEWVELLFEHNDIPSLYVVPRPVTVLYSVGRITVLDSGEDVPGKSRTCAVYCNSTIQRGIDMRKIGPLPLKDVVNSVDTSIRQNIVGVGEWCNTDDKRNAMIDKIKSTVPCDNCNLIISPFGDDSAWVGGSVIGSMRVLDKLWLSQDMYNERGPAVVNYVFW